MSGQQIAFFDEGWSRVFAEQPARRAALENAKAAY